ncbi:MAG: hypothetical protein CMJ75_18990 [Planctomycetaceae bacterium]|nr:hypothetical protein [Planctomycetaceae bacterium]
MKQMLHPDLREHIDALLEVCAYGREHNPEPEALLTAISTNQDWLNAYEWANGIVLNNRVAGLAGNAFAVPFLSEKICDALVRESLKLGAEHGYKPNTEEESPYQIPEIVIKHVDPELFDQLYQTLRYLEVWFLLIYHTSPTDVASIQFARYEEGFTDHGNWHHDRDSDFTAVVSLNPGEFEGGGTDIRLTATSYYSVPPLPKGYALILNGKQIHHRGRRVNKGIRHLLVYWLAGLG